MVEFTIAWHSNHEILKCPTKQTTVNYIILEIVVNMVM